MDTADIPHMMNDANMFVEILPWEGNTTHVTAAGGVAPAKIEGHVTLHVKIGTHNTLIPNVLFVPSLSDPLFSTEQGNYIHIQDKTATVAFDAFTTDVPITNKIYLRIQKSSISIVAKSTKVESPTNDQIKFTKMNNMAKKTIKSTPDSAGLDLFNTKSIRKMPGQRIPVQTGIEIVLPHGTYGRIAPLRGLSPH